MDGEQARPLRPRRRRLIPTPMECLMIVVIICVLALLMVSASGAPRALVRRSTCTKNLKEIGLAIQLYAQDYAGRFPCDAETTSVGSFALLSAKYPKQPTLAAHKTLYAAFVCPNDETAIFHRVVRASTNKLFTAKNLSYAYGGFALSETAAPDTPVACDRSSSAKWTTARPWDKNKWTHGSDGGNILFADGHVAFAKRVAGRMDAMKNP